MYLVEKSQLLDRLLSTPTNSLDFLILITGAEPSEDEQRWFPYLEAAIRALRDGGILFIQGIPQTLSRLGVYLDGRINFKYWIAVESQIRPREYGLPSAHAAILMFVKGKQMRLSKVRFPHEYCRACGKSLRDWGGKAHLMHPAGVAISDVWKSLPKEDNYSHLSGAVLNTLLSMVSPSGEVTETIELMNGMIGPAEGVRDWQIGSVHEPRASYEHQLPLFSISQPENFSTRIPVSSVATPHKELERFLDTIIQGDALEVLRQIPSDSVDLVFADPPYNLDKAYLTYDDEKDKETYLNWCNAWLDEYVRILKPTGSLYVLNLPRWGMHHAAYLSRRLYFQNWIVWDALSEPRGKILPAHYALLFYTKHPTDFTFNYSDVSPIDARFYCLRSTCVRQRKRRREDQKEPLTDIWWDVHRIKHRRYRDYHPCQLPDALLERIIRLSTNPGDVVLDALIGTGTTAIVAKKLGRHFIGIDLDPVYVEIARQKLAQVETFGDVIRASVYKSRPKYNKKALQLELRDIAHQLGRLPTPEDVQRMSRYGLEPFLEAFPTWGKALKAAKLEIGNNGQPS